jgi:hypothetical protein
MRFFPKSSAAITLAALISVAISAEGASPHGASVTVPVMTPLTVKLDETVNARTAANRPGFTATIKNPVQVDGVTVIPANASAGGLVNKQAQAGGELVLNSVFVNGRMYRITTSPVSFSQKTNFRAGSTITFHLVLSLNIAR